MSQMPENNQRQLLPVPGVPGGSRPRKALVNTRGSRHPAAPAWLAGSVRLVGLVPLLAASVDLIAIAPSPRLLLRLLCCHVSAGLPALAPGRAPEWPAGHLTGRGQTVSAVDRTAKVARAMKMPSQTTRPMARPIDTETPSMMSVPIFTAW